MCLYNHIYHRRGKAFRSGNRLKRNFLRQYVEKHVIEILTQNMCAFLRSYASSASNSEVAAKSFSSHTYHLKSGTKPYIMPFKAP